MANTVLVETSARHVHLTEEHIKILFGDGATLTVKKPLSQPGQFACEERQRGIRLLSGILPRKLRENVRSMTGHRGLLHSLLVPAAMLLALPVIGNTNGIEKAFLIGMIAGNLSHLILDMLSGGVPLLIPFSVARIRVCNFRTGGIMDKLWRLVMYFGIGYLGLSELYQIVSKYIRI